MPKIYASFVRNTMLTRLQPQASVFFTAPFRAYHVNRKQHGTRNKRLLYSQQPASTRYTDNETTRTPSTGEKQHSTVKTKKLGVYAAKVAMFSRRYRVRDKLARRHYSKRRLLSPLQHFSLRKQGFLIRHHIAGKALASYGCNRSKKAPSRTRVLPRTFSYKKDKPRAKQRKASKR
jgi:hypothetical protein